MKHSIKSEGVINLFSDVQTEFSLFDPKFLEGLAVLAAVSYTHLGCLSEPKPSPYPYDEHAMIYYCDDLPHPTKEHEAFIEKGVERLLEILSISNGKALVLFTAKTDMEEVYSIPVSYTHLLLHHGHQRYALDSEQE